MTKDRLSWIISVLDFNDLNNWEEKFIEDIEKYFHRKGDLTERQEEILERIFKEKSR